MLSKCAQLSWKEGQPYSENYDDVYFSSDSGIEETKYVFLEHNQLHARWKSLTEHQFTIVETGFGTGLNFLCAWALWDEVAPDRARLNFVSTERYPLTIADLKAALALWPSLAKQSQQLIEQYQHISNGWHSLVFEQGRIRLTLLVGDINDTLPQLNAKVDAWFLDGFSPAKNPDMWQQGLFETMARLSHPKTSFATFTSAGVVRRGLESAGFSAKKVAGFGRKREMLCGHYMAGAVAPAVAKHPNAIVVGGGIAGAASSYSLAERGLQVTLIERHEALAQEASGNPAGVLYTRIGSGGEALSQLALTGYLHSLRLIKQLALNPNDFQACGVLQLAFDAREQARCQAVAVQSWPEGLLRHVSADEASSLAGVDLAYSGTYYPDAGWLNPPALCTALATHNNITIKTSRLALQLKRAGELWQVWDAEECIAEAPIVILANANDTMSFEQSSHCELEAVRGQVSLLPLTQASSRLKTVVCTDGYIIPARQGLHCVGATFSPNDLSTDIREADHIANLAMLNKLSPRLHESLSKNIIQGRTALRCTTKDYVPLAGQLLDSAQLVQNPPRPNADPATLPWLKGLYVNTGHGSKGLISAPLCAEVLATVICGEPAPVAKKILASLNPNRFLLRKMGLKHLASKCFSPTISLTSKNQTYLSSRSIPSNFSTYFS